MGKAGGESAIRLGVAWIILDCEEQLRHCLIETPADKMCDAYCSERRAAPGAGAEAQRGIDMLDRGVGLARPQPEEATDVPAARVVRVQRQGTVNQCRH